MTGGDGKPGHEVWTACPETGGAELRATYWLHHQAATLVPNAEALDMIVIDPTLTERASVSGPLPVATRHAGTDADQDGNLDGLKLYAFQDGDPAGTWRVLWTASDPAGQHAATRRTHDSLRMMVANQALPGALVAANYAAEDPEYGDTLTKAARAAQKQAGIGTTRGVHEDRAPIRADFLREALTKADVVYFGPAHCFGGRRTVTWVRGSRRASLLVNTRALLEKWWTAVETYKPLAGKEYIPYALLDAYDPNGDKNSGIPREHYGLPDNSYTRCKFLFFSTCNSNASTESVCQVLKTRGGVSNVLGYTKTMEVHILDEYTRAFWQAFAGAAGYRLVPQTLQQSATAALVPFWNNIDGFLAGALSSHIWRGYLSDSGIADRRDAGEASRFARFNDLDLDCP